LAISSPVITLLAESEQSGARPTDYYESFKRLFHHSLDPIASLSAHNYRRTYGVKGDLSITWSSESGQNNLVISSTLPANHRVTQRLDNSETQAPIEKLISFMPADSALHTWVKHSGNLFHPRSGDLWAELIPAVLGQRITSKEASAQWRRLHTFCHGYIEHEILRQMSFTEFHRLGVEKARARTLLSLADAHNAIQQADTQSVEQTYQMLMTIPGIGPWTISEALRRSHGWLDAVSVGDFHLCHHVVFALTGRHRGTDSEMLELLEPFRPYRWIVVDSILRNAASPPRKSAGLPTIDIRRF
jgi:3-methyladenine DNA glycosylase/8-oxoguanine DNA glycosylase